MITNYLFSKPQNAYNRLAHISIITEGHEIVYVFVMYEFVMDAVYCHLGKDIICRKFFLITYA